jgi:hypothetical protein
MSGASAGDRARISPGRARRIFGNPKPPTKVWEKQFDYFDRELQKLARKPYDQIDEGDLWYYFLDLSYVEKLQPDLFNYLFPACLEFWYDTLLRNESAEPGGAEFHSSLLSGRILEKMVISVQREAIFDFFEDGLLDRIDQERGFIYAGSQTPANAWIARFNSVGLVAPRIRQIWTRWWEMNSCGQAVAALQYASGLMYLQGENPLFGVWTPTEGGGGPYLWENDSAVHESGWLQENTSFLMEQLSVDYIANKIEQAASKLAGEPEEEKATQLISDLDDRRMIVDRRIKELPVLLSRAPQYGIYEWMAWDAI